MGVPGSPEMNRLIASPASSRQQAVLPRTPSQGLRRTPAEESAELASSDFSAVTRLDGGGMVVLLPFGSLAREVHIVAND
jgi:ABC-type transporter Mla MlaB component